MSNEDGIFEEFSPKAEKQVLTRFFRLLGIHELPLINDLIASDEVERQGEKWQDSIPGIAKAEASR